MVGPVSAGDARSVWTDPAKESVRKTISAIWPALAEALGGVDPVPVQSPRRCVFSPPGGGAANVKGICNGPAVGRLDDAYGPPCCVQHRDFYSQHGRRIVPVWPKEEAR
jgi:hypothetical protein